MGQVIRIKGLRTGDIGFGTVETPTNPGGGSFGDADVKAYFNQVSGLSSGEQSAVNTFVKSLKQKGLWAKMTGIYPFLGTGSASRGANLKDVAKNLSFTGYSGTSEDTLGWKGVAGMYANTGISSNWQDDSGYVYIQNQLPNVTAAFNTDNTGANSFSIMKLSEACYTAAVGLQSAGTGAFSVGIYKGSFLVSAKDGNRSMFTGLTKTSNTYSKQPDITQVQIMCFGSGQGIPVGSVLSLVAFGKSLAETEATDFIEISETFLTALGRK